MKLNQKNIKNKISFLKIKKSIILVAVFLISWGEAISVFAWLETPMSSYKDPSPFALPASLPTPINGITPVYSAYSIMTGNLVEICNDMTANPNKYMTNNSLTAFAMAAYMKQLQMLDSSYRSALNDLANNSQYGYYTIRGSWRPEYANPPLENQFLISHDLSYAPIVEHFNQAFANFRDVRNQKDQLCYDLYSTWQNDH
jgi:hypothetical protein